MKLVVQIPCFNEEENIKNTIKSIPKEIKGIDEIKIIVLDDASYDKSAQIATQEGVDVISSKKNKGLSTVFKIGVDRALELCCDILVNIDGDNQYKAQDIEKLIQPILNKTADIVIGARPIDRIKTFSPLKKFLQKLGSYMVKLLSGADIKDAPSGFRAMNRKALLHLNIFNNFTYTIESIIQAKNKNLIIENVDIEVNEQKGRKSKLFKNNFDYIFKQTRNLIRFFIIYRPARFFMINSLILFILGILLGLRYIYFYLNNSGSGHIQSLILCAIVLSGAFLSLVLAILGDLLSINRKLLEDIKYELRRSKYKK